MRIIRIQFFFIFLLSLLFLVIINCRPGGLSEGPCIHVEPGCYHATVPGTSADPIRYILLHIDDVHNIDDEGDELCDIGGEITILDATMDTIIDGYSIGGRVDSQELSDDRVEYDGYLLLIISPEAAATEEYDLNYFISRGSSRPHSITITSDLPDPALPVPLHLTAREDCPEE